MSTLPRPPCGNCRAPSNPDIPCQICTDQYYCSTDCKDAAWGAHQVVCKVAIAFWTRMGQFRTENMIGDEFWNWLQVCESILSRFTLLALDMANNPSPAYLTSMNVYIYCMACPERREDLPRSFKIIEACLLTDEELYSQIMNCDPFDTVLVKNLRDGRINNANAVRFVVEDETQSPYETYVSLLNSADADFCRQQSPAISAKRSRTWAADLMAELDAANVDFTIDDQAPEN